MEREGRGRAFEVGAARNDPWRAGGGRKGRRAPERGRLLRASLSSRPPALSLISYLSPSKLTKKPSAFQAM